MLSQGIIETVQYYIKSKKFENALSLSENYIEIIASHVDYTDSDEIFNTTLTAESWYTLAKIYLMKGNYPLCINAAINVISTNPEILMNDEEERFLYNKFIIYKLMDHLAESRMEEITDDSMELIKKFILGFFIKFRPSLSLVGYLSQIGLLKLATEMLIENINLFTEESINELLCLLKIRNQVAFTKFSGEIIANKYKIKSKNLLYTILDHLVASSTELELSDFIEQLEYPLSHYAVNYLYLSFGKSVKSKNSSINAISSGVFQTLLMADFMFSQNNTNFNLLESMTKSSAVNFGLCHSIMNAHTMNDTFFTSNKLVRGYNWTRFLDFGGLGFVYFKNGFESLSDFLPGDEKSGEPSTLFSLGLIAANSKYYGKDSEVLMKEAEGYLLNFMEFNLDSYFYGAVMGLAVMKIGTGDLDMFEKIVPFFGKEDTIFQETAAYGIGMIFAGTGNEKVIQQLSIICDACYFVRAKRALCTAIGMIRNPFRKEERKKTLEHSSKLLGAIEKKEDDIPVTAEEEEPLGSSTLSEESDIEADLLGYGVHYANTQNAKVISILLDKIGQGINEHRRQAVISLCLVIGYDGYLMKELVVPLCSNYNLWVRATVPVCLGFFSIGVTDANVVSEIINVLEALMYDDERLVIQGALVGLGFALQQFYSHDSEEDELPGEVKDAALEGKFKTSHGNINYKRIIKKMNSMIGARIESKCVKMGASLGRSIMEIGGKNAITTIMTANNKKVSLERVVSLLMFMNYWYWYPSFNFLSMLVQGTPYFILDSDGNLIGGKDSLTDVDVNREERVIFIKEQKRTRRFRRSKVSYIEDHVVKTVGKVTNGTKLTLKERITFEKEMFEFK